MRITLWISSVAAMGAACVHAQQPSFSCQYTDAAITVDGVLDEPVWETLEPIPFVVPVTLASPESRTIGRICWNEEMLFVAMVASDEDLYATRTGRDTAVFRDDALEIFLQPGPIDWGYHNMEINALGAMLDQQPGGLGTAWNCEGMGLAVVLDGTRNDATDIDRGWTLEAAIPFASLIPGRDVRPTAGAAWRFHLSRLNYPSRNPAERELSSCARLSVPRFHSWPEWAGLQFER